MLWIYGVCGKLPEVVKGSIKMCVNRMKGRGGLVPGKGESASGLCANRMRGGGLAPGEGESASGVCDVTWPFNLFRDGW